MQADDRTRQIEKQARTIGFDLCGVAPAAQFPELERLPEWLKRGYAGEMNYLHDLRRGRLQHVLPDVRSVIVCAVNYNTDLPYSTATDAGAAKEKAWEGNEPHGWMARYAWGEDYHKFVGGKLEKLLAWMGEEFGREFRARGYVDTGPVLEKVAAKYAGLGWLGKNTCLINQRLGSWLFLGVILTNLELTPSLGAREAPPPDLCGSCRRCLDACPTEAIVEPYVLDARRCISYLTIELRGSIPEGLRPGMGQMVFGCDICQDVCPWNRKAPSTKVAEFLPRRIPRARAEGESDAEESLFNPRLEWLGSLDEQRFREVFRGSAVKRTKWRGMIRNTCVALGNAEVSKHAPSYQGMVGLLRGLAQSEDAIIAEHAHWALAQLENQDHPSR